MTICRLLSESTIMLGTAQIEDPAIEAGLILSWGLGKPSSYIYAHPDAELDSSDEELIMGLIVRRCKGEPFQYITGECEFLSLKFKVNPNVLIPRSDTEILAEAAIYALGFDMPFAGGGMFRLDISGGNKKRVLDIGTGSGCLAVGIAHYAQNAAVDALDISEESLSTARENAGQNRVLHRIRFIRADFLNDDGFFDEPYDLIVSNPPYIPQYEEPYLAPSVKDFEPHQALFAGNDGLAFFERIAFLSGKMMKRNGIIVVECGYNQADCVRNIFTRRDMETTVLKDLSGISRVVAARKGLMK